MRKRSFGPGRFHVWAAISEILADGPQIGYSAGRRKARVSAVHPIQAIPPSGSKRFTKDRASIHDLRDLVGLPAACEASLQDNPADGDLADITCCWLGRHRTGCRLTEKGSVARHIRSFPDLLLFPAGYADSRKVRPCWYAMWLAVVE